MICNSKNIAILINSCDSYCDVWPLFFTAFMEYWPKCPYKVYLNSETKSYSHPGLDIVCLNLGAKSELEPWGKRFRNSLKAIESKFVINLFDDFVLENAVNTQEIERCVAWLEEFDDVAVFYFSHIVGVNNSESIFTNFTLVPQWTDYRLNSAPAIWRRDALLKFSGPSDTPWAWEFFGSARTYLSKLKFYCAKPECENIYVYNYKQGGAIHRGKWVRSVVEPLIRRHSIEIDLKIRGLAAEGRSSHPHSFIWKVNFLVTGFKMINIAVFIFMFRAVWKRRPALFGARWA